MTEGRKAPRWGKIAVGLASQTEWDGQYAALHNALRSRLSEPVSDAVEAMRKWMETAPRFFA